MYKIKKAIIKGLYMVGITKVIWKKPRFFKISPGQIYLSPEEGLSSLYRMFELWEPEVKSFIQNEIKKEWKIFEFGSCMGYFSLYLSRKVEKEGKVVGIEPFSRYFKYLKKTKKANPNLNLDFLNLGISSSEKKIKFNERKSPYYLLQNMNKIDYGLKNKEDGENKIKTITLSKLIKKVGFRPDMIFMDIEGGEIIVFDQLLKMEFFPNLFFESHENFYGEKKLREYLDKLSPFYKIKKIENRHWYLEKK